MEGGGLFRPYHAGKTGGEQQRDGTPADQRRGLFTADSTRQQQRHGADRQDQFGKQDHKVGAEVHCAASFCTIATLPPALSIANAVLLSLISLATAGVVTSNTGLG